VQAADPDAYVVVLPTDHDPASPAVFADDVRTAVDACRLLDRVLLLGVAPRTSEAGHELILPGRRLACVGALDVHAVETFAAGPSPELAALLAANGGVWSARILVAPIDRLWMIGCSRLPEVAEPCRRAAALMGAADEAEALDRLSAVLPRRDLTRDLLQRVDDLLVTGCLRAVDHDRAFATSATA
jgi:mannose-1-phosphate guanylyltransferase